MITSHKSQRQSMSKLKYSGYEEKYELYQNGFIDIGAAAASQEGQRLLEKCKRGAESIRPLSKSES